MASVELSKMGGTDVPPAGPADDAHAVTIEGGEATKPESEDSSDDMSKMSTMWLGICFAGIMGSFVCYGMVLEYATSGGRKLHEFSLILVTSAIYSATAFLGRIFQREAPTSVPTYKLAVLAMTSMGSTFTSVRSLRYVIFPVQVLAKSCKPIPVMIMGAFLGKKYPLKKYVNVAVITFGVAMFMGCGDKSKGSNADSDKEGPMMYFGVILLFISLCFDGGTGAYEDKLMHKEHVGPFELMYNIQKGKAILAFIFLMALNEVNYFFQMCYETGPILLLLGFTGACGQIFIFVTISKFGALTCAIIGLARKITTLVVSIIFFGHTLNMLQTAGLVLSVAAMIYNFLDKTGKKKKKKEPAEMLEPKKHLTVEEQAMADDDVMTQNKPLLSDDTVPEEEQDAFPDAIPKTGADALEAGTSASTSMGKGKGKGKEKKKRSKSPKR
mmetsp:Transcript_17662/g.46158  ORF Transcript_17662/g.46158 Transcript_17662/m.46158 type:complete len:441 (-) Transcript_17662:5-1327(-)|eukprot:CAMPEP_0119476424 /NCGR_PEP_ID=MMETSP1344-20130328/6949_1 /TAXON_ID=236787 /ORGANISM="Florenciella parvula, Strain CCMP2471" /LENGTH=440 /DNA_ID=CAMNT_0007510189 /DNA_START=225 /DNA_END=1547 /DNA_ORIENTATION=-